MLLRTGLSPRTESGITGCRESRTSWCTASCPISTSVILSARLCWLFCQVRQGVQQQRSAMTFCQSRQRPAEERSLERESTPVSKKMFDRGVAAMYLHGSDNPSDIVCWDASRHEAFCTPQAEVDDRPVNDDIRSWPKNMGPGALPSNSWMYSWSEAG